MGTSTSRSIVVGDPRRTTTEVVVVGGGISGLVAAYLVRKSTGREVTLFEAADRFGGRALDQPFAGTHVKLGAGIVRERDTRVIQIAKELGIRITWMPGGTTNLKVLEASNLLKEQFELARATTDLTSVAFDDFIGPDKSIYGHWGRTDMMYEDVSRVFTVYGIEDIDGSSKPIGFLSWNDLVEKLVDANMRFGNKLYLNSTIDVHSIPENQIGIIATTSKACKDLLPEVEPWPFYRLYVKIEGPWKESPFRIRTSNTIAQTIIEIDRSKGILMAAYADGYNALEWNKMSMDAKKFKAKEILVNHFGWDPTIRITDAIDKFWEEGIHYVPAGRTTQFAHRVTRMHKNIVFAGEMSAMVNQGWVEGAIEAAQRSASIVLGHVGTA